jgi:hypothetical protein
MKVKKIESSEITMDDINEYKSKTSKLKGVGFTASDVDMDKRIISIRMDTIDNELVLVNPKIVNKSTNSIVYFEKDSTKNKTRKTVRYKSVTIETDNLGLVEFKPTNEKDSWESANDFMMDVGLFETVMVQRLIDAINGIDITHPSIAYNEQRRVGETTGRNQKVMMKSSNGDMIFVKHKKSEEYIKKGYQIV